jgi:hypothetical protein
LTEERVTYRVRGGRRRRTLTGNRQELITRVYADWPEQKLEEHGRRLANRLLAVDEVMLKRFGHPVLSPSGRGIVKLLVGGEL